MARFARYKRSNQKEDLDKSILHYTEAIFLPPISQAGPSLNFVQTFFGLAMLFWYAPKSSNSPKVSNMLLSTSGTSEDFPSIPSTSPEQTLRHHLSGLWKLKLRWALGMGHGISRRWWSSAMTSFPPANLQSFPLPLFSTWAWQPK
jgi:hypothetical protein